MSEALDHPFIAFDKTDEWCMACMKTRKEHNEQRG